MLLVVARYYRFLFVFIRLYRPRRDRSPVIKSLRCVDPNVSRGPKLKPDARVILILVMEIPRLLLSHVELSRETVNQLASSITMRSISRCRVNLGDERASPRVLHIYFQYQQSRMLNHKKLRCVWLEILFGNRSALFSVSKQNSAFLQDLEKNGNILEQFSFKFNVNSKISLILWPFYSVSFETDIPLDDLRGRNLQFLDRKEKKKKKIKRKV